MRGLVKDNLELDGLILRNDLPEVKPAFGEVKIKVLSASVCGTDKGIFASSKNDSIKREMRSYVKDGEAYKPIIVGHEFCGVVESVGQLAQSQNESAAPDNLVVEVGDYVTAEMHLTCGFCNLCRTGNEHICTQMRIKGIHLDGCFAESVVVPGKNVILLSKSSEPRLLTPRVAAMLDAFGNAVHAVNEADVRGKSVAILGAGPLGLMITMLCKHFGARRIFVSEVVDIERRFDLATEFGADQCFDVSKGAQQLYQSIEKNSLGSNGVDIVFEVSGAAKAYNDAFKIIRNGGLVVLLGLAKHPLNDFDITRGVIFKGVTVKGICGRRMFDTWQMMLGLLNTDRFDLKADLEKILATTDFPLEKYEAAFQLLISGKEMKLVFVP